MDVITGEGPVIGEQDFQILTASNQKSSEAGCVKVSNYYLE